MADQLVVVGVHTSRSLFPINPNWRPWSPMPPAVPGRCGPPIVVSADLGTHIGAGSICGIRPRGGGCPGKSSCVTRVQLTDEKWEFIEPYLPIGEYGPYPERLRREFEGGG